MKKVCVNVSVNKGVNKGEAVVKDKDVRPLLEATLGVRA